MWKLVGLLGTFIQFVVGLFSKNSDEHLQDAHKKIDKQDETIAELEEESNANDMEAGLREAENEIRKSNLAERLKNYYKNRGKKQ